MTLSRSGSTLPRPLRRGLLTLLALASAPAWLAHAPGARAAGAEGGVAGPSNLRSNVSATIEHCITTGPQLERSATFVGEMTALAGAAKMEMRIEVLERGPGELQYHAVSAPGLGVWRTAAPGVKVYRYLKQVTDLSAPAFYRGAVRFRWLNVRGRQIAATELRTPRCEQPPLPEAPAPPSAARSTRSARAAILGTALRRAAWP
jgi:hypothetical protein